MDLLQQRITDFPTSIENKPGSSAQRYVCDCGRGGHLPLYMTYLVRDHGYMKWPQQPWFQDITNHGKQYFCPLGRRIVELCDEPQFCSSTRFFLKNRKWLDEKDLVLKLVPELMPPTFDKLQDAKNYCDHIRISSGDSENLVWFLKKINQNGGRAVHVSLGLPTKALEPDEQLQVHIQRPLLCQYSKIINGQEVFGCHKCHVKTYQWIGCTKDEATNKISWQLYIHDLYYLAIADEPFDPSNVSDEVQITTMRRRRLYADHPWRVQWDLTMKCQTNMETILRRAIEQGKLQCHPPSSEIEGQRTAENAALQFEVMSADWMLDEDGNMFFIECNGTPVLYDPSISQPLTTRGLNLYDGLCREDPEGAVVNDSDLLREAIGLALNGKLPKTTLWKHIATIPSP
ncbi:unnamed protein product [Pseudo-nitzschia multistriata]|uniref:Tubulin--tyrosine ligase-like protein 9 n=1 Tax=Pseudo-nitzschia multistriata TaxID=183589 RepID=A0A448Z183_9STRA|nr:unnamed protein product [Pseudo-nitzschia multistriata]